jgi:CRISPR-associated protein Cmr6
MKTPLPQSLTQKVRRSTGAHTGLWFDKFCDQWPTNGWSLKSVADRNPKLDWIRTVAEKAAGDADLLGEHAGRMVALARACGGAVLHFKTASRFATGLGREHPIENGFVWHCALGTPFLPGSSVKGLIRAWAVTWLETDGGSVSRIFGPRDLREVRPNIGSVIFFDALPSKPVKLDADVMTPHYGSYYEHGEVPGDWHSPVPIPFLTVAPGQSFVFALAPRTSSNADRADCHTAVGWLENALLELGAGAKTAVGYGRFERDKKTEEEAEKQRNEDEQKAARNAQLAKLNPIAHEFEESALAEKWDQDKNAFTKEGVIEGWLTRLETTPNADAIHRLRDLVNHHFPGLLANPEKTEGKKNKPAFKSRQRQFALRLNALLNKAP